MKKLLAAILTLAMVSSLLCGITAFAEDATFTADKDWENGAYDAEAGTITNGTYTFTVTLSSSTMTITAFEGPEDIEEVYIPQYYDGSSTYSTIVLNEGAFAEHPSIKKIVVVGALTVAANAFSASATNLELVAGTTATLNASAFAECTAIETVAVTAPTSIAIYKLTTVFNCETLQTISFDSAKFIIGGSAFNSCQNFDKIILNGTPMGVKLDSGKFKVNIRTDMDFHKSRKDPFSGSYVEHLTFDEGITSVVETQFRGASNIKYIDFPASMKYLDSNCFNGCSGVISLDSSKDETASDVVWDLSNIVSVGTCALNMGSLKGEIILGVSYLNNQALRGAQLTRVTFVNAVTGMHGDSLYQMGQMKELVFTVGAAPSFPSTFRGPASSGMIIVYSDTEIESYKAATQPSNVDAMIPFGGYVHTFAENAEGGYDVTYAVANYNEKNIGKAMIALYNEDGAMVGAKTVDATVGTTLTTINVATTDVAASAKIFTLSNIDDITPQYVNYEYVAPVEEEVSE